jgi:hypothetical protein
MTGRLVNNELGRMGKGEKIEEFEILFRNFPGVTGENQD